jgi:flagellar biosynthesis/type III secretory pathway M-ring protein FliF/YscJ
VDWIERLFGISPDGGNGYFEWVVVLFVAFLVAAAMWRRLRRSRSASRARQLPALPR